MVEDVLALTDGMAENYLALQNFLSGVVPNRKPQRGGNYAKSDKRRLRKITLLSQQGNKCIDCGTPFGKVDEATADHVIPYRYGSCLDCNCEFVCDPCNQKREDNRLSVILKYFGSIT